eukprot:SAG31_NODE_19507_length_600_cov_0.524950_2_plen_79_part_01
MRHALADEEGALAALLDPVCARHSSSRWMEQLAKQLAALPRAARARAAPRLRLNVQLRHPTPSYGYHHIFSNVKSTIPR